MKIKSLLRVPSFVSLMLAFTLERAGVVGRNAGAGVPGLRAHRLGARLDRVLPAVAGRPGCDRTAADPRLERLSPSRLLPALYWLEAALFAVLARLTSRFELAPVLVLVLIDGVVALTARSLRARSGRHPQAGGLLHGATRSPTQVFSVCFLIGPLIGGAVVAFGGTVAALLANCGLFALIGVSLAFTALPAHAEHEASPKGRLRAGIAHVRSDPCCATCCRCRASASCSSRSRLRSRSSTPSTRCTSAPTGWRDRRRMGRWCRARQLDLRSLGARRHPQPDTSGALAIAAGLGVLAVARG